MAYHIENTLGLQSGFIDQVNPQLTAEDILRLNSPQVEPKHEELSVPIPVPVPQKAPVTTVSSQAPLSSTTLETSMPKKAPTPAQQEIATPTAAVAALSPEEQLREIRRSNLQLLTTRPGTKTQLGRLTGLSAANVSHRLHGNKIFDYETSLFFGETLGLPQGWFETPQSEETIPADTMQMLLDKSSQAMPSQVNAKPVVRRKAVSAPAAAIPTGLAPTRAAQATLSLSGAALGRTAAPVVAPVVAPATVARVEPAPVARVAPAPAPAPVAEASPVVRAAAPAPKFAPTGKLGPIVEALMQTLALKAKDGKLTEERALQMLVDAATF
jgi:hypothetical protein